MDIVMRRQLVALRPVQKIHLLEREEKKRNW